MSNETENKHLMVKDSTIEEFDGLDVRKPIQQLRIILYSEKTERTLFEQMQAVNNAISVIMERSLEQERPDWMESYINSLIKLQRIYLQQIEALHKLQERRLTYLF